MRLWHYRLIPFLPKSQLIAQWRELNSIFAKEDKHILINYVYEYPKEDLYLYTTAVISELTRRNNKVLPSLNFLKFIHYFKDLHPRYWQHLYISIDGWLHNKWYDKKCLFKHHHTERYLLQCFYNLQEKYDRGQKDFSDLDYEKLYNFVKEEIRGKQK